VAKVAQFFQDIYAMFFDITLVLSPAFLAIAAGVAWLVYRRQNAKGGFWRWLLPARIYLHPSHLIDLQLFVITRAMASLGVLGKVTLTTAIAAFVAAQIPAPALAAQNLSPFLVAFLLWLPSDFANYWTHRLFHNWSRLWPLHAVHHSAEVMTPLTTYRQHPLGVIIALALQSAVIGVVQGVLLGNVSPETSVAMIAGANAFFVLANAALAALHHSHVWLSYGPFWERIIISPAQHQIHHSTNAAHYNKNFGNTLALWDWMFGTLYIIRGAEDVQFGLTDAADLPLRAQRLMPILVSPIQRMFARR
jgi:sterol desaturase/sphingolipid hydroxylase (fatty acid hydroxylase superfamily)